MVYLVGAGPGDSGLLTVKAREVLETADAVVYDKLANEEILNFAPADAEKIFVGKSAGNHTLKQSEINQLLVDLSQRKKNIVRLKGGDPFVFGRGGEEALTLRENNLPFEIIPGVTSAIAVPAYSGIPVTHRSVATSFAVITGHEDPTKGESNIRWEKLAMGTDTLIFLMGVSNLPKITAKLIENGRDGKTPAAIIRQGTKANQEVFITTLEQAANEVATKKITPPAIFIVGEVVNLREKLKWFDEKILFGKKILVTRARSQASVLTKKLKTLGAEVIEFPTIKISPPSDKYESADIAIKNLSDYNRIIFTSFNGVEKFFERLNFLGKDTRALGNLKVAAIGSATANKLFRFGIIADNVPKEFRAEGLIDELKNYVDGEKILLVRAEIARDILPVELEKFGAKVTVAPIYKTESASENSEQIRKLLDNGKIDVVTFTSSSTVKNFVEAVGAESLKKILTAVIGPVTGETLEHFGINANIVATEYTIEGLVEAVKKYYK